MFIVYKSSIMLMQINWSRWQMCGQKLFQNHRVASHEYVYMVLHVCEWRPLVLFTKIEFSTNPHSALMLPIFVWCTHTHTRRLYNELPCGVIRTQTEIAKRPIHAEKAPFAELNRTLTAVEHKTDKIIFQQFNKECFKSCRHFSLPIKPLCVGDGQMFHRLLYRVET